ncbi:MAG: hypothetical protein HY447_02355 [Candidatus Omnitrophica bacterium]|nr:hypothetical protein [Candidatus Omnitrophota bacterium]
MRTILFVSCLLFVACCLNPGQLFAKPERIPIKSEEMRAKEAQIESLASSVNLTRIKDPETRAVLEKIVEALD